MSARYAFPSLVLMIPFAAWSFAWPVAAQDAGGADWEVPRTEHGQPNLQGNWSNSTVTPLQRPQGQGRVLTREQVMELEGTARGYLEESFEPVDPDREAPPQGGIFTGDPALIGPGGGTGGYDYFYLDRGDRVAIVDGEPRSSLITFPENGRIPPVTEHVRAWQAERADFRGHFGDYDHPELRPLAERCIVSFGSNAGPPMLPNYFYNNNYTIVQTADHVAILTEMVHDARIIHLGDGPRLPDDVRPWFGDSWGWWEGDTLVVETTNMHPEQLYQSTPSDNRRVIERFTRLDEETILYEFTVDDPTAWEEPWGGQVPMYAIDDLLHEYACHEGNYALENVLRGARFEERQRVEAGDQDR